MSQKPLLSVKKKDLDINNFTKYNINDFYFILFIASFLITALYLTAFVWYLIDVVMRTEFRYGFYKREMKPGPFIDDRYSWPFFILGLCSLRIFGLPFLTWAFINSRRINPSSMLFIASTLSFFQTMLTIDVFLLFAWFTMGGFFCNNGYFRNGICDTVNVDDYCSAFWPEQPDLCYNGTYPLTDQCDLELNPAFRSFIYFIGAFIFLDTIIVLFANVILYFYNAFVQYYLYFGSSVNEGFAEDAVLDDEIID